MDFTQQQHEQIELMRRGDIVRILIAIECGKFQDVSACLCSPFIRAIIAAFDKLPQPSQDLLLGRLCGCDVPQATYIEPTSVTPASYPTTALPPIPTIATTEPIPPEETKPPEGPECPTTLQDPGYWTGKAQ
jgi:hypothetical protein